MRTPAILTSPLAGTTAVMVALALIAIPLYRLTTAHAAPRVFKVESPTVDDELVTPAVLRLKLLAPAGKLTVGVPGALPLLDLSKIPAGDFEHDVKLPIRDGLCELEVIADFGDATAETAVFLTAMPDGLVDKTLFITGVGELHDVMRFQWPNRHD